MRFLLVLFALTIYSFILHADHGVYFKSNEVSKENRTGIDITHKNNISYVNSFTLNFMISLRSTETHYGEILSLKEQNGKNLIQITYNEPDLYVILNKRETKIHCNLDDLDLLRNRWIPLELKIDCENNMIYFSLGEHKFENAIEFPNSSKFSLSLGVVNKYGFYIEEVPSMSIKDLGIHVNGTPKHLWPFRKTNQTEIKDILSSRTAKLYNPRWVIDYHNKWKKVNTFSFDKIPAIGFDKENEILQFVFTSGEIKSFDLRTNTLSAIKDVKGLPILEKSQQIIYGINSQLTTYSFNENSTTKFLKSSNSWEQDAPRKTDDTPKFWHHNKTIHPISKEITTLFGYGYYSYSNLIQSFDETEKKWKTLQFSGDTIEPRYLSSFGIEKQDSTIGYLFGGLGNPLGKQILGKEFYYDLYKIDFAKKHIKKIWALEQDDQFQYLPVNSLTLTEKDSSFYTLMFPCQKSSTYLKVAKGFLNDPKLYFIGDSIPYEFVDIKSFADLYYWESENKLIALTSKETEGESYEISVYTISYEPGSANEINMYNNTLPLSVKLFYALLASILLFLIFFIRQKIKAKLKKEQIIQEPINSFQEKIPTYELPQINAILLFGGFQVFGQKGKDITYRFSPTLKELFLLILLYSIEDGKGISSRRIQEFLWPDKPEAKAKNNRGVNIKKLRSILEDIDGIEIVFDNNYWKIILQENVFCDIASIQDELKTTDKNKIQFEKIIHILNRGTLLRDIEPEWLDPFKDKTTGLIVSSLEEWVSKLNLDTNIRFAISNVIFEFDQMNETALRVKCSLLSKQGKHSLAMESYEHYVKMYVKLYNEEYQFSFKEIVSENITA
ncbi:MAG: hypothetical protein JEZ01_05800 [Labilibaculum sp.]|nr:hypothetical protein [Labilibaculum sp.]MBI9057266.1 hypothetical protein [Labilibaculum sp.]